MGANEIKSLEQEIRNEIQLLEAKMLKQNKNPSIYEERLNCNLQYLKWMNRKFNLNVGSRNYTVAQREIFYCELGINIGSEQKEYRPVVILQNDRGNISGYTTIIAPITTHNKSVDYDNSVNKYYIEVTLNGNTEKKYLDYYEVPLVLESYNGKPIYGFVNVAHIKEIDRKRISQSSSAKITTECLANIKSALIKNLR